MALRYETKDGDTLDYIVWKQYGSTDNGIVEQVLVANLGLADKGPILSTGTIIILPEIQQTQTTTAKVKLWD